MADEQSDPFRYVHKVYVAAEKENIRGALLRYEQENKIKKRSQFARKIEETTGYRIQRRTLDRFLKEEFNTEQDFINYCEMFLNAVAPPEPADPLGEALSSFLPRPSALPEDWAGQLSGIYRHHYQVDLSEPDALHDRPVWNTITPDGIMTAHSEPSFLESVRRTYTEFILRPARSGAYLEVTEFRVTPEIARAEIGAENRLPRIGRTGVFVPYSAGNYLMLLRSYLHAQLFLLRASGDPPTALRGSTLYPASGDALHSALASNPSAEVTLVRMRDYAPETA